MKIPKSLIQFDTHHALCIVTGATDAVLYSAYRGDIQKINTFVVEKPSFSDREDFGSRGKGQVYESGSKTEMIKKTMHQEFVKRLKETLKDAAKEKWDHVYIFCPATVHNDIEAVLPTAMKKKLVGVWKGNFLRLSPVQILKKIK